MVEVEPVLFKGQLYRKNGKMTQWQESGNCWTKSKGNKEKTSNKMLVLNPNVSLIAENVIPLSTQIKRLSECISKNEPTLFCL